VQRQVTEQFIQFTLMAQQPQVGLRQGRLQETVHHQLGQTVGDADRQAHRRCAHRIAHERRQLLTELKDLVGLPHGCQAGLGQHQPATRGLEQGIAQRAL
jgi:hypothetical protein